LGVLQSSLNDEGAVSENVVREMALGAISRSGADYAVAVSGIAGPDGGTTDKPVGTVWIAWGSKESLQSVRLRFDGGRKWFQIMVAATALDLLRRHIAGINNEPRYFKRRKC
jgi:nicotinamide-nucleotide amidase